MELSPRCCNCISPMTRFRESVLIGGQGFLLCIPCSDTERELVDLMRTHDIPRRTRHYAETTEYRI